MRKIQLLFLLLFFVNVALAQQPCATPNITGVITYDNSQGTPLKATKIYLCTITGIVLDSSITIDNGTFSFCNVANGTYVLTAKTIFLWGGVNAADALIAAHHFVQTLTLEGLRFKAGDINSNSYINSTDALGILNRFVGLSSSFPVGNWVFETPQVTVSNATTQIVNIKGLCSGDLDGSYISFVQSFVTCGDTMTDQRDNQKYPTVQIGTQCWMKRNLNIGTMITSTITQSEHSDCSNNGIIEKYCYNNDAALCNVYGGLYDWNEMMQYDTIAGIQGICPFGWHIPTNEDWCTLNAYLDPTVDCTIVGYTGTNAGGMIKEVGTNHWASPNTGATNQSGFTALGAGMRSPNGLFGSHTLALSIWLSTASLTITVSYGNVTYITSAVGRFYSVKDRGLPVRCVKD